MNTRPVYSNPSVIHACPEGYIVYVNDECSSVICSSLFSLLVLYSDDKKGDNSSQYLNNKQEI